MGDEPNKYKKLPEPIDLEETIAEHETKEAHDPEAGRNTDQDNFMRYAGGGL